MNFEEFMEEWKPLPKDKMTRQIDKAKKSGKHSDDVRAHKMKTAKNYVGRMTDPHKTKQRFTGKDVAKWNVQDNKIKAETAKHSKKHDKAERKLEKALDKDKKFKKKEDKAIKHYKKWASSHKKDAGMKTQADLVNRRSREDDEKQSEVNKKDKAARESAKGMMKGHAERLIDKRKLERAYEKDSAHGSDRSHRVDNNIKAGRTPNTVKAPSGFKPKRKKMKETLNFTDFINDTVSPLYEVKGEIPKCPPGYRFDKNQMMCVPKTRKDAVGDRQKYGDKDLKPGNGSGYNVIGNSGYDGAGYAFEENPTTNDMSNNGGD